MDRQPVNSSAITSIGYDSETFVLEVELRSGAVYRYFAVPPDVHGAFLGAGSKGEYYAHAVRDRYPHVKEPGPPARDQGTGFRGL